MSDSKGVSTFFGPYSYLSERCIGSPDATFNKLLRERFHHAKNLFRRDLRAHFGCVNAIEFSHDGGEWICSGGDDRRVLLWNAEKATSGMQKPFCMKGEHHSNIFCVAFDHENKKVFSGGNDEQVIVHDIKTGESVDVFLHEEAVYGLSVDPVNSNVFASACDDGRVLIYDLRAPPEDDPLCLANYPSSPMHAVMFNPAEPRLVATANSREGLGLWDARKPRSCLVRYGGSLAKQSCMSVRINRTGDKVIGLRRRLPPVLFDLNSPTTVHQFDHSGYYNSCTMKSCCFAGDRDQYIISGSDDFNLYVWKIPEEGCTDWVDEANLILKGHRSIVNQVRFNPANHMIISSGVEKVVKVWSPFPVYGGCGDLGLHDKDSERSVYTHEEYINLVLRSGQLMTHDYTNENTEEDPRMMAFFDSLVQRELEGWSSEDSMDSNSPLNNSYIHSDNSRSSSPDAISEQIESAATDAVLRFFSPFRALTNRSAWSTVGGTLVQHLHTSNSTENEPSAPQNDTNEEETQSNSMQGRAVLLDMDSQGLASHRSNLDLGSSSTNSVATVSVSLSSDAVRNPNQTDSSSAQPLDMSNRRDSSEQTLPGGSSSLNGASNNPDSSHQPQSARSISQLILQKRSEYLAGIEKFHKRAEKRNQQMIERRKEKVKRIRKKLLSRKGANGLEESDSSLSSSSDSDDDESNAAGKAIVSDSSSDSTTSDKHNQSTSGQIVINEMIADRKRVLSRISKFKSLRQRALRNDSSDNSESETDKRKSPQVCYSPKICPPVYEDISSDSCHVDTTKVAENTSTSRENHAAIGESSTKDSSNGPQVNQHFDISTNSDTAESSNNLSCRNISTLSNGHNTKNSSSNGELHIQTNGKLGNLCKSLDGASNCDNEDSHVKPGHETLSTNGLHSVEISKASTSDIKTNRNDNSLPCQGNKNDSCRDSTDIFKKLKSTKKIPRNYRKHDSDNVD